MPDPFHNPYHFVPLGPGIPPETAPLSEFASANAGEPPKRREHPHLTHDRYVKGTHSGRIVCRLTVETPLICGNQQVGNESGEGRHGWTKLLKPFELDGKPAIPGSALRGMLSALAEAATHSAARVMKNNALSHRMAAQKESLSAIGLLVRHCPPGGKPTLRLQPLTVPTLDQRSRYQIPEDFKEMFKSGFHQPLLKAYVDGYSRKLDHRGRRVNPAEIEVTPGSFIATRDPLSQSADCREFWYAPLKGGVAMAGGRISVDAPQLNSDQHRFLLGQRLAGVPIPEAEYDAEKHAGYVRGFLRVLGIQGREREMPPTKEHEYFIPYPQDSETSLPSFEVEPAIQRFHQLADERTEEDPALPFAVRGSRRNDHPGPRNQKLRLRAGDLVYFCPDPVNQSVVAEVSVSSIWRAGNGTVHDYFSAISPELLPLSPTRTLLTLAEQLFGAVEVRTKAQEDSLTSKPAFALAGRLRFSAGLLHSEPPKGAFQMPSELYSQPQRRALHHQVPDIPLKNLASPKPPCPALYFKNARGEHAYIPKRDLKPAEHAPQGRKFYLRRDHRSYSAGVEAFVHPGRLESQTERQSIAKQHQSVEKFVRPDAAFFFCLDFDNLSDLELQLLAYVLEPAPAFRHQLGHGKPLGLGQVKIEIVGLLEMDREQRYRGHLDAPRWHHCWAVGNPEMEWPGRLQKHLPDRLDPLLEKLQSLREGFKTWANDNSLTPVLRALELIGTPVPAGARVHYPQVSGIPSADPNFEREHYRWFVQNDDTNQRRRTGQFLRPLANGRGQVSESLPKLDREQLENPPPLAYHGPAAPTTPPPDRGGAPERARQGATGGKGEERKVAEVHVTPESLHGQRVACRVEKHEQAKLKTRIAFSVPCGRITMIGYLLNPNLPNAVTRFPEGATPEMKVLNPRKVQGVWQCQLEPV